MLFKKSPQIIKIDINNPDPKAIKIASEVLKTGGSIVYPTDTAYGLGVNAYDEKAVKRLYEIKGRDFKKPTHVVCKNWEMISDICETNELVKKLYNKYCPGPLTIISNKREDINIPDMLTGGLSTLGVRIPDCKVTQALSQLVEFPYTTPSANKSSDPTPYSFDQVIESLGDENVDLILDAGTLPDNKPSTVVDLSQGSYKVIREGEIPSREIQKTIRSFYKDRKFVY